MRKIEIKNKKVVALVALFAVSLISAGVFASASITLNSGNPVNLGAGAIGVTVCDQQATISAEQSYDMTDQRFELTTISVKGIEYANCGGKTITLAMQNNGSLVYTTWAIDSAWTTGDLVWGGSAGTGQTGSRALTAIDTANSVISTIAIAAQ